MEDLEMAVGCAFLSLAALFGAYYFMQRVSSRTHKALSELYDRAAKLEALSATISSDMAAVRSGLDTKISRNAMQSVVKQTKELAATVIQQG